MPTANAVDDRPVLLLDTSTAIALILEDHERHAAVLAAVRSRLLGLAGHAWFESYSVLTRLPGGRRRSSQDAERLLSHNFPNSRFLDGDEQRALGSELAQRGISGGAVYDALAAATARHHKLPLLSADERGRPIYEAMGATVVPVTS